MIKIYETLEDEWLNRKNSTGKTWAECIKKGIEFYEVEVDAKKKKEHDESYNDK